MKEAQIQSSLAKVHTLTGCFELKLCKEKSIRFDAVKPHQEEALLKVKHKGLYHKISDFPMFKGSNMRFNHVKPFDFFYLKDVPAYVVICFYVPRKTKTVYYIDIDDWVFAKDMSEKKSITQQEIEQICSHVLEL
jgi:penicillin-binding protein-related factor A (putative recombinase)